MNHFKKAQEISNRIVPPEKFKKTMQQRGWDEKEATMITKAVFNAVLPWLVSVLGDVCKIKPNVSEKNPINEAKFIYIYVVVLNCVKNLISLYVVEKATTFDQIKLQLQATGATALLLAFKAVALDEDIETCYTLRVKDIVYFCMDKCPENLVRNIEREMLKLSDYMPCVAEYKEMAYVINSAKLRVE